MSITLEELIFVIFPLVLSGILIVKKFDNNGEKDLLDKLFKNKEITSETYDKYFKSLK